MICLNWSLSRREDVLGKMVFVSKRSCKLIAGINQMGSKGTLYSLALHNFKTNHFNSKILFHGQINVKYHKKNPKWR
jgi:hypothetical protein